MAASHGKVNITIKADLTELQDALAEAQAAAKSLEAALAKVSAAKITFDSPEAKQEKPPCTTTPTTRRPSLADDGLVYYSAEHGILNPTPEGYEPAAVSAAKDIVQAELECLYDIVDEDDYQLGLIHLADSVVEALLEAGVQIPENLKSPFGGARG